MNTTVKAFHCPISEIRGDNVRSGILIYPLPDADQILRDRIYLALAKLHIQISDFIITDPTSIEPWCKSVGIQPINTPSLLGIWIYKDDAQKYVNLIQKIVFEYLELMIKVTVTAAHIAAAKYPSESPLALALREMGYTDAHVTQHYAYIEAKVYALPESAIASERCFDFLAKGGSSQGEIAENIFAYECELVELVQ